MAMTVHLYLTANGTKIDGDSSILSLDRENSIECLSFEDSVRTAREASSGMASGERTYEPVRVTKRIDKSSPLLAKALCDNEVIEATFKFFRPNPAGDGTTQIDRLSVRTRLVAEQLPDFARRLIGRPIQDHAERALLVVLDDQHHAAIEIGIG